MPVIQSKYGLGIRFEAHIKHGCFISDLFNGDFCFVVCCKALILPNYLVHHFKPGEGALCLVYACSLPFSLKAFICISVQYSV